MMGRPHSFVAIALLALLAGCGSFDPMMVEPSDRGSPAAFSELPPIEDARPAPAPLALQPCGGELAQLASLSPADALWIALCRNPRTRESWAAIAAATATLGGRYTEYLPTITSDSTYGEGHVQQAVPTAPFLNQGSHFADARTTVDFDWVLYSGGKREAEIEAARQNVLFAKATHNAEMLGVVGDVMQQYYRVVAAQGAVTARREAEQAARNSFDIANGRNSGGVAPVADVLQAKAALDQAVLNRVQAEGALAQQMGALAAALGVTAQTALRLDAPLTVPTSQDLSVIDTLVAAAERAHPAVVAARARVESQRAGVDAAESEGLPILALTGSIDADRASGQLSFPEPTTSLRDVWGLRLEIPLSEGFSRGYDIRRAEAEVGEANAELQQAQIQVSLAVWASYQNLKTDFAALQTVNSLVATAKRSYDVALGRYQNGIGNIIELLNAQVALASAQQQRVQLSAQCLADRIRLDTSLGYLDMNHVR
jgi:outer membrane protein